MMTSAGSLTLSDCDVSTPFLAAAALTGRYAIESSSLPGWGSAHEVDVVSSSTLGRRIEVVTKPSRALTSSTFTSLGPECVTEWRANTTLQTMLILACTQDVTVNVAGRLIAPRAASSETGVLARLYVNNLQEGMKESVATGRSIERLLLEVRQLLQQEPVLDGFKHPAERGLRQLFADYPSEAAEWAMRRLSERGSSSRASDILKLLCRFKPRSPTWRRDIAAVALRSPAEDLRDIGIQAVESWGEPELIYLLKAHSEKTPWLADYARQVLRDLGG